MMDPLRYQQLTAQSDLLGEFFAEHPDSVVDLLRFMGAQDIKVSANEVRSSCPLHGGRRPDAFVVWTDRGRAIWQCHTDCGTKGTLTQAVQRRYQCRFADAVEWLTRFAGMDPASMGTIPVEVLEAKALDSLNRQLGLDHHRREAVVFPESMVVESRQRSHRLFLDRGYPQSLLDRFEVGFVPGRTWVWPDPVNPSKMRGWFEDRISIPWRMMDGTLVGFDGRRVDGVKHRKYMTLAGTRKSHTLYGIHRPEVVEAVRRRRRLVLVEGEADQWRACQHDRCDTAAVGGVELSRRQISLITQLCVNLVVLLFDADTPGQTAAMRMAEQLSGIARVANAIPPDGQDPSDIVDRNRFEELIEQATPVVATHA